MALFLSLNTYAQHLDLGFTVGNASYLGDLVTPRNGGHINQKNLSKSAFLSFTMDRFSFRASILQTDIEANDDNGIYPGRGLHFRTPIFEAALVTSINLAYIDFNYGNSYWSPYIFGGIAAYQFNPQGYHQGEWFDLQPLGTEGQGIEGYANPYKLTELAIPFGIGLKAKFSKRIGIGIELGFRKLFNDYLDDVSGVEVNYLELYNGNGPIAVALSAPSGSDIVDAKESTYTRGASGNDIYYIYEFSFFYTFAGSDEQLRFYYR